MQSAHDGLQYPGDTYAASPRGPGQVVASPGGRRRAHAGECASGEPAAGNQPCPAAHTREHKRGSPPGRIESASEPTPGLELSNGVPARLPAPSGGALMRNQASNIVA
jgi:hypothetical protein